MKWWDGNSSANQRLNRRGVEGKGEDEDLNKGSGATLV